MASRLGELLVRAKVIDDLQLRSATAHQAQWGGRIPHIVIERGFAEAAAVTEALSKALQVPRVELEGVTKDPAALAVLDAEYARERAVFPCALKDGGKTLWVAMADPTDVPTIDDIAARTRARVRTVIASETEIVTAIERHYLGREPTMSPLRFTGYDPMMAAEDGEEGKIVNLSGTRIADTPRPDEFHTPAYPQPAYAPPPPAQPQRPSAPPAAGSGPFGPPKSTLGDVGTPSSPLPGAAPRGALPPGSATVASAEELLRRARAGAASFGPQELRRLRELVDQQEVCTRMLRALLDLCFERGCIDAAEYKARLR